MDPSSILCRAQETYHRDRAANASLANVRLVSGKAAVTWGLEAVAADRREARRDRMRIIAELVEIQNLDASKNEDTLLSENPDRGFANTRPVLIVE